jgi:hypothetical protein
MIRSLLLGQHQNALALAASRRSIVFMAAELRLQTFNNDLLLGPEDRDNARLAFPALFYVLHDDDLLQQFQKYEEPAKAAKRKSLRWGLIAVVLVIVALFGTSAEHLDEIYLTHRLAVALACLSAVLGLAGVLIGMFGVMIGKAKAEWLHRRLMTEVLRQFHFQTFVCRVDDILALLGSEDGKRRFVEQRRKWLAEINLRFAYHLESELHALTQKGPGLNVWLHPAPNEPEQPVLDALPTEYFDAYRVLRICHQQQYADWKIRFGQFVASGFSLRALESILATGGIVATLGLLITESLVIVPLAIYAPEAGLSPWAQWIAVCFAVTALGMRTLEEGLQPKREIERYQRHGDLVADILERFDAGSRQIKFQAMIEMERLAFEEMRDFLRTARESRFVM